jgi:hypothetical protein
MGTKEGSIMANIMTAHMPRNERAAPVHVWPGIRIQTIDIVQPPGMGMSPIVAMLPHQAIVAAALATNTASDMARKARSELSLQAVRARDAASIMSFPTVSVCRSPGAGLLIGA